jgi:hypothetical protein
MLELKVFCPTLLEALGLKKTATPASPEAAVTKTSIPIAGPNPYFPLSATLSVVADTHS